MPPDTPELQVNLDQWMAAASRAAPAVGAIILIWSALEAVMNGMVITMRGIKARERDTRVNFRLSHKPRERLNEWIRTVLPVSGRQAEGGDFRDEFLRLKQVRDNLAHNIQAMWISHKNELVIMAMFDRKDYLREADEWFARVGARGGQDLNDKHPSPFGSALYRDANLLVAYEEMRQLLGFVNEVHSVEGLPRMKGAQDAGLAPAHPPQGDLRANPKGKAQ